MSQPSQPSLQDAKPHYPAVNYLNADRGVKSWLLTLDHKRIAVMYLASVLVMFLSAASSRWRSGSSCSRPTHDHGRQHLQPHVHAARRGHDLPVHDPGHPGRVRQLLLPSMLGAKDVAFPKLNLLSLYLYWTGPSWRSARWSWAAPTRAGRSTRPTARRRR
jgi:Heme/copper-type cytochrome/quinol oxidases, subunit 1